MNYREGKARFLKANLKPHEHYAGIIMAEEDYHLFVIAVPGAHRLKGAERMLRSMHGYSLPTVDECRLLAVNTPGILKSDWYWTSKTGSSEGAFRQWCFNFKDFDFFPLFADIKVQMCIVRRLPC